MNQAEKTYPSADFYKRGVFVLVSQSPDGTDSYLSFSYKRPFFGTVPSFHLAVFNEIQFANWYLTNLKKELKDGTRSETLVYDSLFILEIENQAQWDKARKAVLDGGEIKNGILNPCEERKNHRCPITCIYFDEYADFGKLKEDLSRYPNQHIIMVDERVGEGNILILANPTVLNAKVSGR